MRVRAIYERLSIALLGQSKVYHAKDLTALINEGSYPAIVIIPGDETAEADSTVSRDTVQTFDHTVTIRTFVQSEVIDQLEDIRDLTKNALIGFEITHPQHYTPLMFIAGEMVANQGGFIHWVDIYGCRRTLGYSRST